MILSFLNQKGGAGKSTLSVNVAAELAKGGARVLLIDGDTQGSALDWAAARSGDPLVNVVGIPRGTIHKELAELSKGYAHVIIDGPGRATEIVRSAILASDIVVIPVQPSPYDIWAAEVVVKMVEEALVFKPSIKPFFVINRKISGTAIGRDVKDALERYSIPTAASEIVQRVIFAEAVATGQAVYELDEKSPAAAEIAALVNELKEEFAK